MVTLGKHKPARKRATTADMADVMAELKELGFTIIENVGNSVVVAEWSDLTE